MTRRRSGARIASTEAREEYLRQAEELWERFNTWYAAHPDATFDEMEEELRRVKEESAQKALSVEQEYLLDQLEEMKERLKQRNLEFEALKTREKAIHKQIFEKDEKIQELTSIMTMIEENLQEQIKENEKIRKELERQGRDLAKVEDEKMKQEILDFKH